MNSLYMQLLPHQRAKGAGLLDPNLTELIFDLGAFRERMGIVFRLEIMDRHTLKVFYDDDQTFTALRLGYGERFVAQWPEPQQNFQSINRSQRSASQAPVRTFPTPSTGRRGKEKDWVALMKQLDEAQNEKPDPRPYVLDDVEESTMAKVYQRMLKQARG